ncbi:MAG: phosphomannose isomerase type II C-terminal cupin domain [Cyanobium sp.]
MDPLPLPIPVSEAGRCHRPWGWFETLTEGEGYRVKRLWIAAGRRISLQRHHHRCEHWVVVGGQGLIELQGTLTQAICGTSLFIPVGAIHRAAAATEALEIIEVQRGADLREDDIERFDDDYGRVVMSLNTL